MRNTNVIVIGAGPAGLSAGLWCSDLGLRTVVLERAYEPGGQLLSVYNQIKNYPGYYAANGVELRDLIREQVDRSEATLLLSVNIASSDLANRSLTLDDGSELAADHIIIATGVRRRMLNVPGEGSLADRGILTSGVRDRADVKGRNVVIVGGGDAALENALMLSEVAAKVTIVHRRDTFAARDEFVSAARARKNVDIVLNSNVSRILGEDFLTGIEINGSGDARTIACDNLLIRIGVEPNSEPFRGQIEVDTDGYIVVDRDCRTSLPDVFAAGDAASPLSPTIATAVGMGATAAKVIASQK